LFEQAAHLLGVDRARHVSFCLCWHQPARRLDGIRKFDQHAVAGGLERAPLVEFGSIRSWRRLLRRASGLSPSSHLLRSSLQQSPLRRTFAGKARDALNRGATGYSQWTIGQVMGHARSEMPLAMTMGVYAGKEGLEAMLACVFGPAKLSYAGKSVTA
jgi:hypothetical protein